MHQELQELALRYGKPAETVINLGENGYLAVASPRVAEVCLVFQRPGGKLLTMTKPFYPEGVFRLPTGGIELGESVSEALEREIWEETGLEATILRYLAHLTYQHNEGRLFHSHVFLLEADGEPDPQDAAEQISGFREVELGELVRVVEQLEALPEQRSAQLQATWRDWGRFRAAVHRAAYETLAQRN